MHDKYLHERGPEYINYHHIWTPCAALTNFYIQRYTLGTIVPATDPNTNDPDVAAQPYELSETSSDT